MGSPDLESEEVRGGLAHGCTQEEERLMEVPGNSWLTFYSYVIVCHAESFSQGLPFLLPGFKMLKGILKRRGRTRPPLI